MKAYWFSYVAQIAEVQDHEFYWKVNPSENKEKYICVANVFEDPEFVKVNGNEEKCMEERVKEIVVHEHL
mgnify:CR=1 FL=1